MATQKFSADYNIESKQSALLRLVTSCRELMRTALACPVNADTVGLEGGANSSHVILLR